MFPLVFYGVCDSGSGYHYRLLRASLTSLLRNYSGQVLIAADRELKIPCDRVRVVKVDVDDYYYGAFELRLRLGEFIQGLPTRTYPLDHLRVLYLDVDTIVTRPLDGLFADCDRHDGIYYAPEDREWYPGGEYHGKYVMTDEECKQAATTRPPAYNAGMWLATWKYMAPAFDSYRALYRAMLDKNVPHEARPGFSDQSVLNTLIYRGVINAIPFPTTHVQTSMRVGTEMPLPTIMHFADGARGRMMDFSPPAMDQIAMECDGVDFKGPSHLIPKALYLNRPDRRDRRAFMEDQLDAVGVRYERVNAPLADEAGGFMAKAGRANFLSHVEMIERVARDNYGYLILEDDAIIGNIYDVASAIRLMNEKGDDWAVLYFYGVPERQGQTVERVRHLTDVLAYIVNPPWAARLAGLLREKYEWIVHHGPKDWSTYIDSYFCHELQDQIPCFGTQCCVTQDRNRFGSNTGWYR
jgi:hypothetical protein